VTLLSNEAYYPGLQALHSSLQVADSALQVPGSLPLAPLLNF